MSEPISILEQTYQWERETALLESTQATLEWDERTGMPPAAGAYRAEQITYLSGLIHQRRTDAAQADRIDSLVQCANQQPDNEDLVVTARYLKRNLVRRQKLPLDLVQAMTKAIVLGQQAWSQARKAKSFADFLPCLNTIVKLKRVAKERNKPSRVQMGRRGLGGSGQEGRPTNSKVECNAISISWPALYRHTGSQYPIIFSCRKLGIPIDDILQIFNGIRQS